MCTVHCSSNTLMIMLVSLVLYITISIFSSVNPVHCSEVQKIDSDAVDFWLSSGHCIETFVYTCLMPVERVPLLLILGEDGNTCVGGVRDTSFRDWVVVLLVVPWVPLETIGRIWTWTIYHVPYNSPVGFIYMWCSGWRHISRFFLEFVAVSL